MKRASLLILTLFLAFTWRGGGAAEEEKQAELLSGDYSYVLLEDGTAEITGYTGDDSSLASLTLPGTLDGRAVTSIGHKAFFGRDFLTGVTIPQSVTRIGDLAFAYCWFLSGVRIPDNVTHIGDYAFRGCQELESVTIGRSVETVGANPFSGCGSLMDFLLPPEHPLLQVVDGVLCDRQEMRLIGRVGSISGEFYAVPDGTLIIGDEAFYESYILKGVTIPDSVTRIGDYAFGDCSLESVTIGRSVRTVGANPFRGCHLTEIAVSPDHPWLRVVDGVLFHHPDKRLICCPAVLQLETYKVPDGTVSIGNSAFENCHNLTGLTIPGSVTSIGDSAFAGCTGLTVLTLPQDVTSIGLGAFDFCLNLTGLTIPQGVTRVSDWMFSECESLTEVTIPDSVTSIGEEAFSGCTELAALTLPEGVTDIGKGAFRGCYSLNSLGIPEGLTNIAAYVFAGCEGLGDIQIPKGVTSIGEGAFSECGSLISLTIPEGVTGIGEHAFEDSSEFTSLTIPDSVISIGESAFDGCPDLILRIEQGSYAQARVRENKIAAQFSHRGSSDEAAPFVPDGTLVPLEVRLPEGKKLPVYTGPGKEYARAGNGKANVSTNGWVQVFGRENDWLLVQYAVNDSQMRFGYVPAKGLKLPESLTDLTSLWEVASFSLIQPALLTDDPLSSSTEIARLSKGLQVRRLGWMGFCSYVEALDGERLLRGFVESKLLVAAPPK